MPKRTAANTIVVQRGAQRLTVKPGQTFDFTNEEIADINSVAPRALKKPVNEQPVQEVKLPDAPKPQGGKGKQKDEKPETPAPASTGDAPADDL
jgi:hypothetical protein